LEYIFDPRVSSGVKIIFINQWQKQKVVTHRHSDLNPEVKDLVYIQKTNKAHIRLERTTKRNTLDKVDKGLLTRE